GVTPMPDIIPEVTVDNDDPMVAAANVTGIKRAIEDWRALAQSGGQGARILFPPGKIWINETIYLYETEAGITLEGQGWNLDSQVPPQFDLGATGNTLLINLSSGDYTVSPVLHVLSRNIGYQDTVLYPDAPPPTSLTLTSGDPDNYAVGDYVFLFHADAF